MAIRLVSDVPERVWYCTKKGYKPWLRPSASDVKQHTVWYDEPGLFAEVKKRVGGSEAVKRLTLSAAAKDGLMSVGAMGSDGQLVLGKTKAAAKAEAHLRDRLVKLKPSVARLAELETAAQRSFYALKRMRVA